MDVAALLAEYLRAPVPSRRGMVASNSRLFTPDMVAALDEAYATLLQARSQARDAYRSIDDVMGNIDLPSLPRLTPMERSELDLTEEAIIAQFADHLSTLLAQGAMTGAALAGEALSVGGTSCNFAKPWHKQCSIVLAILSFLPVEFTFNVAENVCKLWRTWLYVSADSQAFWTGCVQQEFPETLQALLQLQDVDLYQSDWRTIAMVCCADKDKGVLVEEEELPVS
ncbi:hypothetical protein TraAM80_02686 [Trypanosoma rangeli]|uniref:F-box domain-containing protein n=1 Tax=Trypanosoma rangeli TaxID=5698 RepID=A0A422NSY2_TRYRA|nr:uncharacterized protein TraAM80_02686 [Trypanosoma rangeli]RNF08578.1 hypothetical protein TraAM80_02686 [Trypanosoma rangeli]|eukprot:RNF08578.1 hypothetical protein TraAM80_02686 [Trypanosoma rangeli]